MIEIVRDGDSRAWGKMVADDGYGHGHGDGDKRDI